MIYVVSYKLSPNRDMSGLFDELQKPPSGWAHHLDETWFIATDETAQQLHDRIEPFFNDTDLYIVVKIGATPFDIATAQGMMPKQFWEWFNNPTHHI